MAKDKKKTGGGDGGEPVTSVEDALARGQEAVARVKPKNAALYWALTAQTLVLGEIRDMMREDRSRSEEATSGRGQEDSDVGETDTSTTSRSRASKGSARTRSRTTGVAKSGTDSQTGTASTSRGRSTGSGKRSPTGSQ